LPPVTITAITEATSEEVQGNSTPRPQDDPGTDYGPTPVAEETQESGGGNSDGQNSDPKPTEKENDASNDHGTKVPGK
jgi:hypothetical protein